MDLLRPTLFDFHGVFMTNYFTDNWGKVQNFKAKPDDIVVATYPKAGTTWLCYILDLLHFQQTYPEREKSVPIYNRVPFLELARPPYPTGTDKADTLLTSPRIIKTHLPVQFLPKSFWEQNSRIVYIARNAKDNVVSYFHKVQRGQMTLDESWKTFLGLSTSAEERREIARRVQFDVMKVNPMTNLKDDATLDFSVSQFRRKGKVGDWKNHFTVNQKEQFDEDYKQKMKNTTLKFRVEI